MNRICCVFPLLLLFLCPITSSSSPASKENKCSSISVGTDFPAVINRCATEGARYRYAVAIVLNNATCLLCGSKNTPFLSAQHCHDDRCVSYRRWFQPGSGEDRVLLFRTHASKDVDVYDAFNAKYLNGTIMVPEQETSKGWYKSPLMDVAHMIGVETIELQLLDESWNVVLRMKFEMSGPVQQVKKWFSLENLKDSYPISKDKLKGDEKIVKFTKGLGSIGETQILGFLIMKPLSQDCQTFNGYLLVSKKCYDGERDIPFDHYAWTEDGGDLNKGKKAPVFQLVGLMAKEPTARIYGIHSGE